MCPRFLWYYMVNIMAADVLVTQPMTIKNWDTAAKQSTSCLKHVCELGEKQKFAST